MFQLNEKRSISLVPKDIKKYYSFKFYKKILLLIAKMILGCSNSLFPNFIHLFYKIFAVLCKGKKEILKMYRAIPVTALVMFLFISSFARAYFTAYPIGTILEISILLSVLAGIEKLGPNINQYSCKVGVCGVGGYITKTINKPPKKFELFVHPDKGRTKTNLPPMATHFK